MNADLYTPDEKFTMTSLNQRLTSLNTKVDKSTLVDKTLLASGWTGSTAPFTYNLEVAGVTTTSNQELLSTTDITQAQLEALQSANIVDGGQLLNTIILKAYGDKPTIDIPIRVVLRGDG